jgi:5-methyltetrahydrofolate--homocysteine methyltransferase
MPDQFTQLKEIVIAGDGEAAKRLTSEFLSAGLAPREILEGALLPAMDVVGARMRSGECFIPRSCSAPAPCRAPSTS